MRQIEKRMTRLDHPLFHNTLIQFTCSFVVATSSQQCRDRCDDRCDADADPKEWTFAASTSPSTLLD